MEDERNEIWRPEGGRLKLSNPSPFILQPSALRVLVIAALTAFVLACGQAGTATSRLAPTAAPTASATVAPAPIPTNPPPSVTPPAVPHLSIARAVNLRSGPGTTFAVIRPLAAKTELDLLAVMGDGNGRWYKVRSGDDIGWVSGTVVAVDDAVAAALPTEESFAAVAAPTEPPAAPTAAPAAAPSARAAIVIVKEPGTVSAGRRASVTIRTAPRATCSITVWYKSGPSTAAGLDDAQADAKGLMNWS
jgi:hypothetical protein